LLVCSRSFHGDWLPRGSPRTVVARAAGRVVDNDCIRDRAVIHTNVAGVYVVRRLVVIEPIPVPVAALIAGADVSLSVINPSVITNVMAPIPIVIAVPVARVSPVARRPQKPRFRRTRPGTGNPVITVGRITPISRCPQVTVAGAFRLRIFGQWWRRFRGV
jgi:hypothetical protein